MKTDVNVCVCGGGGDKEDLGNGSLKNHWRMNEMIYQRESRK